MNGRRFIIAGNFIDGSGADVRKNVLITVQDGSIAAIDPIICPPPMDGATVDDFSHCTVLPPLVDCSVALARSPAVDKRLRLFSRDAGPAETAAMVVRHIRYCHAYGVLGAAVIDPINVLEGVGLERILEVRTASPLDSRGQDGLVDNTAAGDFLRIGYSADIDSDEGPQPRLNKDDLYRLLHHRGGRKAVVVANGERPVAEALAAGCQAIEQGYGMGEGNLRKMVEKDVLWIPGILRAKNALDGAGSGGEVCCRFSQRYVAPGKPVPGAEAFWQKVFQGQMAQLRFARNIGVKTALGTGAGSVGILHGESMVEEMKLFVKAGYSLVEAIRCASENGARFFGMDSLGVLAIGKPATFLLARGTVQQLPRKLAYLEGIYIDGTPSGEYRKNPVKAS